MYCLTHHIPALVAFGYYYIRSETFVKLYHFIGPLIWATFQGIVSKHVGMFVLIHTGHDYSCGVGGLFAGGGRIDPDRHADQFRLYFNSVPLDYFMVP
jgi:hypothetical protein